MKASILSRCPAVTTGAVSQPPSTTPSRRRPRPSSPDRETANQPKFALEFRPGEDPRVFVGNITYYLDKTAEEAKAEKAGAKTAKTEKKAEKVDS